MPVDGNGIPRKDNHFAGAPYLYDLTSSFADESPTLLRVGAWAAWMRHGCLSQEILFFEIHPVRSQLTGHMPRHL